jgi:hypothetical protein
MAGRTLPLRTADLTGQFSLEGLRACILVRGPERTYVTT